VKVLIAEDEPVLRHALEAMLTGWGYEVVVTRDGAEACRFLHDGSCAMAVLDWMMPGMNGLEVCREVRRSGIQPYVYLLLLTARDRRQDIVAGLEAGADDYLVKPFDAHELKARLLAGRRIIDLQTELIAARESLRYRALHDALTGLWNHGAICELLARELARSQREGRPVGVALADIDHFKRVNDAHGHLAGDAILRAVSRRLVEALRPYDAVGRYGGEEFLIVLPGCDVDLAGPLGERLRCAVASKPMEVDGTFLTVSISLGMTASVPGMAADASTLIRTADAALYRGKEGGRNCVAIAPLPTRA
jgi:diguanylate cyclase (GGDEF)-like protein